MATLSPFREMDEKKKNGGVLEPTDNGENFICVKDNSLGNMEKTDGDQERPYHDGNTVEFSFSVIVFGDKKKLAKVSEVFSAQFAW